MTTRDTSAAASAVPYLAVHEAAGALDWYARAFDAVEVVRHVGSDGRVGHAEFEIGGATFYLADEYPEFGVLSPRTLGGTATAIHLTIPDVDRVFAVAVEAGAASVAPPADQPHGARHGTLTDPFGHRWMLSSSIGTPSPAEYERAMADAGFSTVVPRPINGHVWPAVNAIDATATIRFMVDVLGFHESLVVAGADPQIIEHSQLLWPEGGTVQVSSAGRDGVFAALPTGAQSIYLVTDATSEVYARCVAAGADIVLPPISPDYDPQGSVFTVRDAEGNLWSIGTYRGA